MNRGDDLSPLMWIVGVVLAVFIVLRVLVPHDPGGDDWASCPVVLHGGC